MLTVILVKVFEEPLRKSIQEETTSQSRELATSAWRSLYGYPSLSEYGEEETFSVLKIVLPCIFFLQETN